MKMKTVEYYMSLPYRIEIQPIPEYLGGGFDASIPELGKYSVHAEGDKEQEALTNLKQIQRERIAEYIAEGVAIPEPVLEEEEFSGKILVRIPKSLHRELRENAKRNNVSLNHFISFVLAKGIEEEKSESRMMTILNHIYTLRDDAFLSPYNKIEISGNIVDTIGTKNAKKNLRIVA